MLSHRLTIIASYAVGNYCELLPYHIVQFVHTYEVLFYSGTFSHPSCFPSDSHRLTVIASYAVGNYCELLPYRAVCSYLWSLSSTIQIISYNTSSATSSRRHSQVGQDNTTGRKQYSLNFSEKKFKPYTAVTSPQLKSDLRIAVAVINKLAFDGIWSGSHWHIPKIKKDIETYENCLLLLFPEQSLICVKSCTGCWFCLCCDNCYACEVIKD